VARLKQLSEQSELLKDAVAHAEQLQAKRLADDTGKLAKEQHALMGSDPPEKGSEPDKLKAHVEKLASDMKQLASDTLRLAQQASGPEAKKMAQESARAAEQARQAMEKGLAEKAKGKPEAAKALEAETLQQFEIVRKNLEGIADKMPGKAQLSKMPPKTGDALTDGQKQVQMAQQKLQAQPRQAPKAMQQAARALDKTAQQMSQQIAQSLPKRAGRQAIGAGAPGGLALPAPLAKKLEPFQGRSWGELPGELKTQLLQDARAYFGEDYAPIIQQYFEQITERRKP
jgi:hypothetical protein